VGRKTLRNHRSSRLFVWGLLTVVSLNYLAQVVYYLHLYYWPHRLAPNWTGTGLLSATLVWFLAGYILFLRHRPMGRWLLLSFLAAEVAFYVNNLAVQASAGYGLFYHLRAKDPALLAVFLVGYINLVVGALSIGYLLTSGKTAAQELDE
jgi:hypothetical protein